jgi:hypothetical protein
MLQVVAALTIFILMTRGVIYAPRVVTYAPGSVFTALHFLLNLRMSLISKSVTVHLAKDFTMTNSLAHWENS